MPDRETLAERDRARTLAVALEQEVAALTGAVDAALEPVERVARDWVEQCALEIDNRIDTPITNARLRSAAILRAAVEQGRREAGL